MCYFFDFEEEEEDLPFEEAEPRKKTGNKERKEGKSERKTV